MPYQRAEIPSTYYSIDRPVVLKVIKQVMDATQISSQTKINFVGAENKTFQQNSAIDEKDISIENKWPYDERIFIEVDLDANLDNIFSTAIYQNENIPIFNDYKLDVFVRPIYRNQKVSINFKYRAIDRNTAIQWRNSMNLKISGMMNIFLHEVNYRYMINPDFIETIYDMWKLREAVAPYNDGDFNYYLTKYLTTAAKIHSDQAGQSKQWMIDEGQCNIQGRFDFTETPDKESKEGDHDNFVINFSHIFTFDKPIELVMFYPLVIHNQLVPIKYLPKETVYKPEDRPRFFSQSGLAFNYFSTEQSVLNLNNANGYKIPVFDEFRPDVLIPSSINVFTTLATISPLDKRFLFNLKELVDIKLSEELLNFLQTVEYSYLGTNFASLFTLTLYQYSNILETKSLMVDNNLNVSSTFDLDLRKNYHIRFGIMTNFSLLTTSALQRIANSPMLAVELINFINYVLQVLGGSSDIPFNTLPEKYIKILTSKLPANYLKRLNVKTQQAQYIVTQKNREEV